jgi:hypothetical protein
VIGRRLLRSRASWTGSGRSATSFEAYWEVFDPFAHSEPVGGSLSDDGLDIYKDLRGGLALWDGHSKIAGIWEWRFFFEIHWGNHAVDALRVLHRACRTL